MAIDFEAIKRKLEKMSNTGGSSKDIWKPTDSHTIRIVPIPNDSDPFKERWFYYNLAKGKSIVAPGKTFGKADPIEELRQKLFNEGTKDSINLAKRIGAKARYYAPIIVRSEESEGVRWWAFGKQVYTKLLEMILDPEYGDITDPHAGTDIKLSYKKSESPTDFAKTDIWGARKTSPLAENQKKIDELLASVKPLEELFKENTYAELESMLDEWMNTLDTVVNEEEIDDGKEVAVPSTDKPAQKNSKVSDSAAASDINESFDDLLA